MEGDPGIWHRSFWFSAVTKNEDKSTSALLPPPDLQLAGKLITCTYIYVYVYVYMYIYVYVYVYTMEDDFRGTIKNDKCFLC